MFRKTTLTTVMLLPLLSGCLAQVRDDLDDTKLSIRDHYRAKCAYRNSAAMFCNVNCPRAFKAGFFAGYIDMMNGSNGCPPVFAPRSGCCEWLDHCSEEDRTNAWHDGYEQGVVAAQHDGVVDSNRLPARLPTVQVIPTELMPGNVNESLPLMPTPLPSAPTPTLTDPTGTPPLP